MCHKTYSNIVTYHTMKSFISFLVLSILLTISTFAQKGKDDALNFIGASSGSVLYNSHLVIGLAADSYADKVYDGEMVREIVEDQLNLLANFKEQTAKLRDSGFLSNKDDILYCNDIIKITGLVEAEGESLKKYILSQAEADGDTYSKANETAWNELVRLLELDKE